MKTCAVCQTDCKPEQDTCHACGEASWHPGATASATTAPEAPTAPAALADVPAIALGPGDSDAAADPLASLDEPDGAPEVTEAPPDQLPLVDGATASATTAASKGRRR